MTSSLCSTLIGKREEREISRLDIILNNRYTGPEKNAGEISFSGPDRSDRPCMPVCHETLCSIMSSPILFFEEFVSSHHVEKVGV